MDFIQPGFVYNSYYAFTAPIQRNCNNGLFLCNMDLECRINVFNTQPSIDLLRQRVTIIQCNLICCVQD